MRSELAAESNFTPPELIRYRGKRAIAILMARLCAGQIGRCPIAATGRRSSWSLAVSVVRRLGHLPSRSPLRPTSQNDREPIDHYRQIDFVLSATRRSIANPSIFNQKI